MPARPLQRIFYVDDDEIVQRLVKIALERIGALTVEMVNDSALAIDGIRSFKPDLVLLDCIMPKIDGIELFHQMRSIPELAAIPVVFFTVRAHWRTGDELLALGAAGVITKPFDARELAGQLKEIWNGLPEAGDSAA